MVIGQSSVKNMARDMLSLEGKHWLDLVYDCICYNQHGYELYCTIEHKWVDWKVVKE